MPRQHSAEFGSIVEQRTVDSRHYISWAEAETAEWGAAASRQQPASGEYRRQPACRLGGFPAGGQTGAASGVFSRNASAWADSNDNRQLSQGRFGGR